MYHGRSIYVGSMPRLWFSALSFLFEMAAVPRPRWRRLSTAQFAGAAALHPHLQRENPWPAAAKTLGQYQNDEMSP